MFSKSAEYAMRAAIFIAQQTSDGTKVGMQEIADAIGSPKAFTAKILQHLTSKNDPIISSTTGPGGGFYVTEQARKKSAWKILEALNENGVLENCILGLKNCSDTNPCPMHYEYKTIRTQLIKAFKGKSLDELANSHFNIGAPE